MEYLLKGFAKDFAAKHGKAALEKNTNETKANEASGSNVAGASNKSVNCKGHARINVVCRRCAHNIENIVKAGPTMEKETHLSNRQIKKIQKLDAKAEFCHRTIQDSLEKNKPTSVLKPNEGLKPNSVLKPSPIFKLNTGAVPKVTENNIQQGNQNSDKLNKNQKKQPKRREKLMQAKGITVQIDDNVTTETKPTCNIDENKSTKMSQIQPKHIHTKQCQATVGPSSGTELRDRHLAKKLKSKKQIVTKNTAKKAKQQPSPPPVINNKLLKPVIFEVPNEQLLLWAREFKHLIVTSLNETSIPFYEIRRHFDMPCAVTKDPRIMQICKKFLTEQKDGYFSYTPNEELRSLLVLKRPSAFSNCNKLMVQNALQALCIPVLRVDDFKAMWKPEYSYNRYLVEVERKFDLQVLFKYTKLLEHDGWMWSKLKKPSITQCRNCQRYGHVASNCRMPFRCVKCKDPHEVGKCPRTYTKAGVKSVYCHNCNKTGHPSNYRGCPAYKERCKALKRQRTSAHLSSVIKKMVNSVHKALQKNHMFG